jgi:hypothetical protein
VFTGGNEEEGCFKKRKMEREEIGNVGYNDKMGSISRVL